MDVHIPKVKYSNTDGDVNSNSKSIMSTRTYCI
jgi:hypothetical protein